MIMDSVFDPTEYKINTKINWNKVAPDYHYNWADKDVGPFKSTKELVKAAEIKPNDLVLDLACGTGTVSREISHHLGNLGRLVGIDISRIALSIAKKTVQFQNVDFIEMDAENIGLHASFDKIVCQYALMFFPDTNNVLKSIKSIMKKDGKLVVAVHGTQEGVPYFSSIMKPILHYIPNIRISGTPTVHRFGNSEDLQKEISLAGFSDTKIRKFTFTYDAGSFEEYWTDYIHSTANAIWPKIERRGIEIVNAIKNGAEKNTLPFIKNGKIKFPWDVLIATAYH
jgi:ubiquinone/menaquinone biosynthesis C-methylase UbiE